MAVRVCLKGIAAALAVAALMSGDATRSSAQAQNAELPTAQEIVAKYDVALGGEAAIRRHTSETMRGTVDALMPGGRVTMPFVYYAAAPDLRVEKTTLPRNQGQVLTGFDGQIAWGLDPQAGPTIATGNDRESVRRDADFYYPLDELTWFRSMQTVSVENFEGQRCYRLHGVSNWGEPNDQFYNVETGLLAGYEFTANAPNGPALMHEIFTEYKPVDGVQVPMRQEIKFKPQRGGGWQVGQTQKFTEITFNDVDPSVFTPPAAVKNLAAMNGARGSGR